MKQAYTNPTVSVIRCDKTDILTASLLFEEAYDGDVRKWSDVF